MLTHKVESDGLTLVALHGGWNVPEKDRRFVICYTARGFQLVPADKIREAL
jgi:hypothetical protein